jgi:hypothetical protein
MPNATVGNILASVKPNIPTEGETETLKSGQIWLCMTRQPRETDDIVQSKYFELEVCLADKGGSIVRDVVNKLPLQVLLLYEDLTWVDQQNLLEIDPKSPAIIDREGYVRMRVRILDISRVHSRRKFVVYVAAANENLTLGVALSRPLFVLSRKSKRAKPDFPTPAETVSALAEKAMAQVTEPAAYVKALISGAAKAKVLSSEPLIPSAKRIKTEPLFNVKPESSPAVNLFMASFNSLSEEERRSAFSTLAQQMSSDELKCVVCEFLSRSDKQ